MNVDLSAVLIPLAYAFFGILGSAVLTLAGLALNKFGGKMNAQTKQIIMDNLQQAAAASVHAGMMATQPEIAKLGLNNFTTQNKVTDEALRYFVDKFAETAKASGADVTTQEGRKAVRDVISRVLPVAATMAVASPVITMPTVPSTTMASVGQMTGASR